MARIKNTFIDKILKEKKISFSKNKNFYVYVYINVENGVGVFNTATVKEAKGAIIIDADGKELIDFAGGIGVVNAGHCPEPVVEAIRQQAGKYLHTSFNVVTYEPYVKLCEELVEILPETNFKIRSIFTHLAASDEPEHDSFSNQQYKSFIKWTRR
mgnify:CR=1 FL=1